MVNDLRVSTYASQTSGTSGYPTGYEIDKLNDAVDELCDEILNVDPLMLATYFDLTLTGAARYRIPDYIPFDYGEILMIADVTGGSDYPVQTVSTAWQDRMQYIDNSIMTEYEPFSIIDDYLEFPLLPGSGTMRVWYTRRPVGMLYGTCGATVSSTTFTLPTTPTEGEVVVQDDYYIGMKVYFGGQIRRITDYVASTKVATIDAAWATNPTASTSTVEIIAPLPNRYLDLAVMMATRAIRIAHDDPIQELDYIIEKKLKAMKLRMSRKNSMGGENVRNISRL